MRIHSAWLWSLVVVVIGFAMGCNQHWVRDTNPECPLCHGRGEYQCEACRGAGKVRCDRCDASAPGRSRCSTCNASGFQTVNNASVRCRTCNGSGWTNCSQCDGTAKMSCHECHGDGRKKCGQWVDNDKDPQTSVTMKPNTAPAQPAPAAPASGASTTPVAPKMKACGTCGKKIDALANFCSGCGSKQGPGQ